MADMRKFTFPSSDRVHTIHGLQWIPDGPPRAIVQIIHGVSEHMGRYDHTAQVLANRGFLVCGIDILGHGRSAENGKFGYFAARDGWTTVTDDIRRLREDMGRAHPGLPYFLLGHSMGSFLARTYLIRWPGSITGAVLSGTGQEPALVVALGKHVSDLLCRVKGPEHISDLVYSLSLGAYNKKFQPSRTSNDWLNRDEAMVDAYLADPMCSFVPTVSLFRDMLGGLQFIAKRRNLSRMDPNTPIYFFSGDQDPVGSMGKGVEKVVGLFRRAGCRDVTVKLYPQGRHEMLNELNRDEVMGDLLIWLETHM